MSDQDAQNRQLPATPRKIRKAREDGQVARSRDLGHFAALVAGIGTLALLAPLGLSVCEQLLVSQFSFDARAVSNPQDMTRRLGGAGVDFLLIVLPVGFTIVVVAGLAALLAGGWNFTWKALKPRLDKINPIAGIGRVFSKQQLVDAAKASLLALVLGAIGAFFLYHHFAQFMHALSLPLPVAVRESAVLVLLGVGLLVLALAGFAVVDVPWQRHALLTRLKMSVQEVKQENKEVEGSPEVKGRQRSRQREIAQRRMLAAVPKADLVVMNPTHYAVALKYDEGSMAAPRVVAKGADLLAMRIRDVAREHEVPVLQSPMLARALYAHGELDREIPAALYGAVAQVLAYVYQLREAMRGRMPMPGQAPEPEVPPELDPHHARAGSEEAQA